MLDGPGADSVGVRAGCSRGKANASSSMPDEYCVVSGEYRGDEPRESLPELAPTLGPECRRMGAGGRELKLDSPVCRCAPNLNEASESRARPTGASATG